MPVGKLGNVRRIMEKQTAWAEATETIRARLHAIEQPALLQKTTGEAFDKIKTMIRKRPQNRTAYERQITDLSERQFGVDPTKLEQRLKGDTKLEW